MNAVVNFFPVSAIALWEANTSIQCNTLRLRFFDENSRSQRRDKSLPRRDKSPSLQ
ncbi:hypothetical protein [Nostoc sp. NMS4]|uniref:hypothetical protein n=1 Tax=Nostoc sp. NMS4 TaxID=2815390 RepID=UPI0025DD60F1|nr:hypothetical protein [Nostoc sp. NMS4]